MLCTRTGDGLHQGHHIVDAHQQLVQLDAGRGDVAVPDDRGQQKELGHIAQRHALDDVGKAAAAIAVRPTDAATAAVAAADRMEVAQGEQQQRQQQLVYVAKWANEYQLNAGVVDCFCCLYQCS